MYDSKYITFNIQYLNSHLVIGSLTFLYHTSVTNRQALTCRLYKITGNGGNIFNVQKPFYMQFIF